MRQPGINTKLHPPFISNLKIADGLTAGRTTISIDGNWPTPAWVHKKTEVDVDEIAGVITVRYLGSSHQGIAMQVLKPFSEEIDIEIPMAGEWTIIVISRAGQVEETVFVM